MKAIILYSSRSGNTKKIADAMASQLNCEAIKITSDSIPSLLSLEKYDIFLIGTGLYAGTPNEDMMKYLGKLDLRNPKLFALFITWGGTPRSDKMALTRLRALLESNGQKVLQENFACFGGWKGILIKRGHPKTEEIQAAGEWAKKLVASLETNC